MLTEELELNYYKMKEQVKNKHNRLFRLFQQMHYTPRNNKQVGLDHYLQEYM
jgi:hypothetical protein